MKFSNYTQTNKNSLDCFRLRLRNDVHKATSLRAVYGEAIQEFTGEKYYILCINANVPHLNLKISSKSELNFYFCSLKKLNIKNRIYG
jgi:hypothetical protein